MGRFHTTVSVNLQYMVVWSVRYFPGSFTSVFVVATSIAFFRHISSSNNRCVEKTNILCTSTPLMSYPVHSISEKYTGIQFWIPDSWMLYQKK